MPTFWPTGRSCRMCDMSGVCRRRWRVRIGYSSRRAFGGTRTRLDRPGTPDRLAALRGGCHQRSEAASLRRRERHRRPGTRTSAATPPSASTDCPRCSIRGRSRGSTVDAASFDALAATIAQCPSGALKLYRPDGTLAVASGAPAPSAAIPAVAKVRPNGPNVISGDVVLTGARATGSKPDATLGLCRCGVSREQAVLRRHAHAKAGFCDPGLLPADAPAGVAGARHA